MSGVGETVPGRAIAPKPRLRTIKRQRKLKVPFSRQVLVFRREAERNCGRAADDCWIAREEIASFRNDRLIHDVVLRPEPKETA